MCAYIPAINLPLPFEETGAEKPVPCLTLTQPWATLVAVGAKRIETRSWGRSHRGDILIHAAKGFPTWAKEMCSTEPFEQVLAEHGYTHWNQLPRSVILAKATVTDIRPTNGGILPARTSQEFAFGDYGPNRYLWDLADVCRLLEPVPCAGARLLWKPPAEKLLEVEAAIAATRDPEHVYRHQKFESFVRYLHQQNAQKDIMTL